MSQSPPPAPSNSPPPPPPSQPLQQLWRQTQPVLKAVTLTTLRGTIRVLQFAADKIEGAPPTLAAGARPTAIGAAPPPQVTGTAPQTNGTAAPADAIGSAAPTPPPPAPPAQPGVLTEIRLAWEQFQGFWGWLLRQVRSLLPAEWSAKLSNTALSSILVGSLLLVFWTSSALSPDKTPPSQAKAPAKPPEVAIAPPPESAPPAPEPSPTPVPPDLAAPPELTAPEPPAPVLPEAEEPEAAAPEPIGEPPAEPEPTPAPPPPPLVLTPEQSLIAAIQDEVADVTSQYADGLIQSIQANFRSSRLIVRVGEDWYSLPRSRQDSLADEMLKRAKELDFSKLEITDPAGALLARSPVVGTEMIVLQRQLPGSAATS